MQIARSNITCLSILIFIFSCAYYTESFAGEWSAIAKCKKLSDEDRLKCFDAIPDPNQSTASQGQPDTANKPREVTSKNPANTLETAQNTEQKAQLSLKEPYEESTRKMIADHMELTYFTIKQGRRFGADETRGDILLEAQIFKNISWTDGSCFGKMCWLDIPIRLGVRQLTSNSMPVRTPSYNPGLRWFISGAKKDQSQIYCSIGLHHYSNGQDAPSIAADGSVNKQNGSFSTNYAEFAGHKAWDEGEIRWARLAFRQHFYGTWDKAQYDQYPKRHLSLEFQTDKHRIPILDTGDLQFKISETYGWGYNFIVKNDIDPTKNVGANTSDKFNTTLEMFIKPEGFSELAFYLRYDYGYDYYNINFQNRINRLQFGFAGHVF